jgi:hypothetical protein
LLVQGPVDGLPHAQRPSVARHGWAEKLGARTLAQLQRLLHTKAAPLLAGEVAREAIDRGAHLPPVSWASDARATLEELGQCLRIEDVRVGHHLRLALADLAYDLHAPARQGLLRALSVVPETATALDLQSVAPRVLGVVAKRAIR